MAIFQKYWKVSGFLCLGFLLFANPVWAQIKLSRQSEIALEVGGGKLQMPWAGGLNALQFSNFDFNNDGKEDLYAFDRTTGKSFVFLWENGDWTYAPEFEYVLPEGLNSWVLWVDADCDGIKDIFTSTPLGIRVFKTNRNAQNQLSFSLLKNPILTIGFSGNINLQVSPTDVPYIGDVDGDGLPDILVYNFASGGFIEFHKNISLENGGTCGNLAFRRITTQWGDFEECDCNTFAFGGQECPPFIENARVEHAGGKTIQLLDINGDGLPDLLTGHELCEELYFLPNSGTQSTARFQSFENRFPNTEKPANFVLFPAAYAVESTGDGLKDLLVSSNQAFNLLNQSNFRKSVWLYRNTGSNAQPNFEFVKENFLQDQMLDLGENAFPTAADVNGDGKMDILLGYRGQNQNGQFIGGLALLLNIGSQNNASFRLETENFADIQSLGFTNIKPQFIDWNGNGIKDLLFSATKNGQTRLYAWLAERINNQLSFKPENITDLGLSIGLNDNPHFFDVDADGKADVLLARSGGRLDLFLQKGTPGNPNFQLETQAYLGIDDNTSRVNLSVLAGDFTGDGKADLFLADFSGEVSFIADFKGANPKIEKELYNLSGTITSTRFGNRMFLGAAELSGSNKSLLVGSGGGGMGIFEIEVLVPRIPKPEILSLVQVFPNPAKQSVFINLKESSNLQVFNAQGQLLVNNLRLEKGETFFDSIQNWPKGLYFFKFNFPAIKHSETLKIIKE